jgi:hypothetical protein
VVATLALGIGASTAIFSVVNGILPAAAASLPIPAASCGSTRRTAPADPISISWPNYLDWKARTRSFDTLAVSRASSFTWTGAGDGRRLVGRRVTANFFQALGVQPSLGRDFAERDDLPSLPGGDRLGRILAQGSRGATDAIGRTLTLDGPGLHPSSASFPGGSAICVPYDCLHRDGSVLRESIVTERGNHSGFVGLARLKSGRHDRGAALRELQGVEAQIAQEHPDVASGSRRRRAAARRAAGQHDSSRHCWCSPARSASCCSSPVPMSPTCSSRAAPGAGGELSVRAALGARRTRDRGADARREHAAVDGRRRLRDPFWRSDCCASSSPSLQREPRAWTKCASTVSRCSSR